MVHSGSFLTHRTAEDALSLLAAPERFVPLLPDYESMTVEDAAHCTVRLVLSVAQITGHANLNLELHQTPSDGVVEYRGQGLVAGSRFTLRIRFHVAPIGGSTRVNWQGEVELEGMLALLGGDLLDAMGRRNFDLLAERLQAALAAQTLAPTEKPSREQSTGPDFDI